MAKRTYDMELKAEEFQGALEDTLIVLSALKRHCSDIDELCGLIKLAVDGNKAQAQILHKLIQAEQDQGTRRK